jgi:hypothetical protein
MRTGEALAAFILFLHEAGLGAFYDDLDKIVTLRQ